MDRTEENVWVLKRYNINSGYTAISGVFSTEELAYAEIERLEEVWEHKMLYSVQCAPMYGEEK